MLKQIFRTTLPNDSLFNLLDQISLKTDKYYLIDKIVTFSVNFNSVWIIWSLLNLLDSLKLLRILSLI